MDGRGTTHLWAKKYISETTSQRKEYDKTLYFRFRLVSYELGLSKGANGPPLDSSSNISGIDQQPNLVDTLLLMRSEALPKMAT